MKLAIIGCNDAVISGEMSKYINHTEVTGLILGHEEGLRGAAMLWVDRYKIPVIYALPYYDTDGDEAELFARRKIINYADKILYFATGNGDIEWVRDACAEKKKPLEIFYII